jgi:hypothetical protein
MEGFKTSQKMQCFKEGGAVKYKSRHSEKSEMSEDIAQDKKVVKKAFAMHDKQSHEGDKTNLSKLKKGGRMKKEGGCVGRYKDGGTIKTKVAKTKKAKAPSKAAIKPAMSNIAEPAPAISPDMGMMPPPMMKKGGALKKCAEGGSLKSVDAEENPGLAKLPTNVRNKMGYAKKGGEVKKYNAGGIVDNIKSVGKKLYENVMGTPEQNKAAAEQEKAIAEKDPSSYEAKYRKLTGKKRGGKAC